MNIENRRKLYQRCVEDNYEQQELKMSSANNSCNYMMELFYLIKNIPNWEIYLNEKQIIITKLFITYKNVSDIAKITNISYGSIYSALFGSSIKDEQGIYGQLKKVHSLNNKHKVEKGSLGDVLASNMAVVDNSINLKENLIKYAKLLPNYKDFLTKNQSDVLDLYLEHLSCSKVDNILGKKVAWTTLYGKTKKNPGGVYKILQKESRKL